MADAEDEEKKDADARKIKEIVFDDYIVGTWYDSPYPAEYTEKPRLNICEFCMKYFKSELEAYRHKVCKRVFML